MSLCRLAFALWFFALLCFCPLRFVFLLGALSVCFCFVLFCLCFVCAPLPLPACGFCMFLLVLLVDFCLLIFMLAFPFTSPAHLHLPEVSLKAVSLLPGLPGGRGRICVQFTSPIPRPRRDWVCCCCCCCCT